MKQNRYLTKLRDLFRDKQLRSTAVLGLVLASLIILIVPAFIFQRSLKDSLELHKQKYLELIAISKDYIQLKGRTETAEKKQSPAAKAGIANIFNDIFTSLGVKGKVKSITGISNRDLPGNITEESAEIYIEKVTMNEMINIFYKIETSHVILSVKKASIKKSFEKPELLDLKITLALFNLPHKEQQ